MNKLPPPPPADSVETRAPAPAQGTCAPGFQAVAEQFAAQLREGAEIGAAFCVYRGGEKVVDLWGGLADVRAQRPWRADTRAVVFSVTKGLAAMALNLLADRGQLEWDAPVAARWPGFAQAGKEWMTARTLFNHQGGLAGLDVPFTLADCVDPARAAALTEALEKQAPDWPPGERQGYHAITFGMYARELFERIAGEPMGAFLQRELFEPLGAEVSVGTPERHDGEIAQIYPPATAARIAHMLGAALRGGSTESRVARDALSRRSMVRRAFANPSMGKRGLLAYNEPPVRRAGLLWASATASARGLARAYLPFALGGSVDGRRYLRPGSLEPLYRRQGWSERDLVLQKPLGWSQGFLKEEPQIFSPVRESFGHAGMGGALGWCDPVNRLSFGYVLNRLDWRVRSPRTLALCRALYACEALRGSQR